MVPPPNEAAYEIWIVPDYGYAPVRVYEYRSGGLHHLWEYSGLKPQTENLYVPTQAKVWYCSTDKKIKDFDPQTPGNNWGARVDVQIKSFVFNQQEYPDSFFSPEIPNGYYVIDGLEGLTYTAGDPSSRRKVAGGLRDTMKVTSGTVSTSK
ncbi:TPA: hypothetical protein DDW35_11155 [Candidatus Sumerlaeota bacterium]|nr:hypothetical protein [Candidatus Sumerlaeota bacterium]